jgi:Tfp pilus assembly protein PilV
MIDALDIQRRQDAADKTGRSDRGIAAIVEVLVLAVLLVAVFAVGLQLLVSASSQSEEAGRVQDAVLVAQSIAEEFSADPLGVPSEQTRDGFTVTCAVEPEDTSSGTLYHAHIEVGDETGEAYELETARYVSEAA